MTDQWHFAVERPWNASLFSEASALGSGFSSPLDSRSLLSPRHFRMQLGFPVGVGGWGYHSSPAHYVAALHTAWHGTASAPRVGDRAVEQRDAADEGRLEAYGSIMVGTVIVNQGQGRAPLAADRECSADMGRPR
jgi:hypothetical protein